MPEPATPDCWAVITTLIQTISAVAVAVIAGLALGTWRKQLKGQTRFDAATRLSITSHRLAQTFHGARNRFIHWNELPTDYNNNRPNEGSVDDDKRAYRAACNARWRPVGECYATIEGLLPEVRALLPDEVADTTERLLGCARQRYFWMGEYADSMDLESQTNSRPVGEHLAKQRKAGMKTVFAAIPQQGAEIDTPLTLERLERHRTLGTTLKRFIDIA
jgi:hypothetical protein